MPDEQVLGELTSPPKSWAIQNQDRFGLRSLPRRVGGPWVEFCGGVGGWEVAAQALPRSAFRRDP